MANDEPLKHTIDLTRFTNGEVRFQPERPGRPETTQVNGNVTVTNTAIAPTPSFFEVSFNIGVDLSIDGTRLSSSLHLSVPIHAERSDRSYEELENTAAELLPSMLRTTAELIEADLERASAEKAAREAEEFAQPQGS